MQEKPFSHIFLKSSNTAKAKVITQVITLVKQFTRKTLRNVMILRLKGVTAI